MKNLPTIGFVTVQLALLGGIVAVIALVHSNQVRLQEELHSLGTTLVEQQGRLNRLDVKHAETLEKVGEGGSDIRLVSQQLRRVDEKLPPLAGVMQQLSERLVKVEKDLPGITKAGQAALEAQAETTRKHLENIQSEILEKSTAPPLRWAYVDKFKLIELARKLVRQTVLTPEQDPGQNPELARKLAEYQQLQMTMGRILSTPRNFSGSPGQDPTAAESERQALQRKIDELKAPLAAYLKRQSGATDSQNELVERALRKFSEGKYDLVIDKVFGDHHILYRAAQPIPDVTTGVADLLREMAAQ